jgi:hypothetical protein
MLLSGTAANKEGTPVAMGILTKQQQNLGVSGRVTPASTGMVMPKT